jgi:hypothetical protein
MPASSAFAGSFLANSGTGEAQSATTILLVAVRDAKVAWLWCELLGRFGQPISTHATHPDYLSRSDLLWKDCPLDLFVHPFLLFCGNLELLGCWASI